MWRYARLVVSSSSIFAVGLLATASSASATTPTITSVSPNNGPTVGLTSVKIKGTEFTEGASVKFGGTTGYMVKVESPTSITVQDTSGTGTLNVTVTDSGGTSAITPYDQFAYDTPPDGPWLGLNGNSSTYLGPVDAFVEHSVVYDRSGAIEWEAGQLPKAGEALEADIEDGMIPDITFEYKGYPGCEWGHECLPSGAALTTYVTGFVKSAEAILKAYPGRQILFEPINEPYGYGTAAQYANIIAKLMPEAEKAGIPLSDIYVAAYGRHWIPKIYETQPKLRTEVQGWYFHPYGPAKGTAEENSAGIQSLPVVQSEMTSGQNNIIVSEVGYWTPDVNEGKSKGGPASAWAENSTQAAVWLTEMLENAAPYYEAGWLKALIVYSRNDGGWATQLSGGSLTKQGEALDTFADAHDWAIQPSPLLIEPEGTGGRLRAVSCTSTTACVSVGNYQVPDDGENGTFDPTAEIWNGSAWSAQLVPRPPAEEEVHLWGVSCTSATACTAVGQFQDYWEEGYNVHLGFAERWNGTKWTLQTTTNPSGAIYSEYRGVSCESSTSCITVGSYKVSPNKRRMLAEKWNGEGWTIQTTPNPAGTEESELYGIGCTSTTTCTAVGSDWGSSHTAMTLAERWSESEWVAQTTPNPTGAKGSELLGVSCPSSTVCFAVGDYKNSSGYPSTLAEKWDSTGWHLQTIASPSGSRASELLSVSCTGEASCVAVGRYENSSGSVRGTLAEKWNGATWTIQRSPNPSNAAESVLAGVSCVTTSCVASGEGFSGNEAETLTEIGF